MSGYLSIEREIEALGEITRITQRAYTLAAECGIHVPMEHQTPDRVMRLLVATGSRTSTDTAMYLAGLCSMTSAGNEAEAMNLLVAKVWHLEELAVTISPAHLHEFQRAGWRVRQRDRHFSGNPEK